VPRRETRKYVLYRAVGAIYDELTLAVLLCFSNVAKRGAQLHEQASAGTKWNDLLS
jgi:hypothetical protein